MEIKFTLEDIRNHLSDLGYKNVPEEKLKMFVTDLKRLIKYEERRRHLDNKLDSGKTSSDMSPTRHKLREKRRRSARRQESVPDGASAPDPASVRVSAAVERTTSSVRTMTMTSHEESSAAGTTTSTTTSVREELHQQTTEQSSLYVDIVIPRSRSAAQKPDPPLTATLLQQRPASGVIRCRSTAGAGSAPARRGRADPVKLHQEYRKAWDKLNLPGETSHNKLRWAVRDWMMGEEPSA